MISRIEAGCFRCFRELNQRVEPLQILVGPNGSGKSTFVDVVAFLGTLTAETVQSAIEERSENFHDLVWGRNGTRFRLAIEATIPDDKKTRYEAPQPHTIRYEVALQFDKVLETVGFGNERISLRAGEHRVIDRPVLVRDSKGVHFTAEIGQNHFDFELSQRYSGLSNLPMDETGFPATTWLKTLLREGVRNVRLDAESLRSPSPPSQRRATDYNGWHLPKTRATDVLHEGAKWSGGHPG